ncbi:O-methyltransferase [Quillaja saponaria]|uniref:isoflavone 7-O-methyltransferase n=1 Tax=Quillaja saponaria TaxID=32244 RepID=A0AAD7QHD4_QUISA|nr:O-methyltransferase [Quillaja saponaria]
MELLNAKNSTHLLEAQAHVWNHIFQFINSMSLKCAIQLGIPDIIYNHGQPMTLPQLIASLPIHPSKSKFVYRLIRILVHSGFLAQQNVSYESDQIEEGYVLTNASKLLPKDNPMSVRPFLLFVLGPVFTEPCHCLSSWFQNDSPTPFVTAHGISFWDYAAHDPKINNNFNEAMASDAQLISRMMINGKGKEVFEGLETLVDVGGGTGTLAKAIAHTFAQLECIVFDLPHVVAGLQGSMNLKFVGGDMFETIPPANAILLKSTLHDWSDEECVRILKKCKEVISGKGKTAKVIIIDIVIETEKKDYKLIQTQQLFDMEMMVLSTGRERNEKEWTKLFFSAGFRDYKISPILGLRSVIEVYP